MSYLNEQGLCPTRMNCDPDGCGTITLRSGPRAVRLEWLTAMWMLIEAAVAIGSGIAAHSLSLIAFGADSLIELASGCCSAVAASCGAAPGGGVPREGRASSEPSRRRTPLCPRRLYRREQRLQLMDARGSGILDTGLGACPSGDPGHVAAREGQDAAGRRTRKPCAPRRSSSR